MIPWERAPSFKHILTTPNMREANARKICEIQDILITKKTALFSSKPKARDGTNQKNSTKLVKTKRRTNPTQRYPQMTVPLLLGF